jgi:hypothetical protein
MIAIVDWYSSGVAPFAAQPGYRAYLKGIGASLTSIVAKRHENVRPDQSEESEVDRQSFDSGHDALEQQQSSLAPAQRADDVHHHQASSAASTE